MSYGLSRGRTGAASEEAVRFILSSSPGLQWSDSVFNIHGNEYRLICAIHYDTGKVFLLRFLTHAQYSKDGWKDEL